MSKQIPVSPLKFSKKLQNCFKKLQNNIKTTITFIFKRNFYTIFQNFSTTLSIFLFFCKKIQM